MVRTLGKLNIFPNDSKQALESLYHFRPYYIVYKYYIARGIYKTTPEYNINLTAHMVILTTVTAPDRVRPAMDKCLI